MKRIAYALVVAFGLTSVVNAQQPAVVPVSSDVLAEQTLRNIDSLNVTAADKAEAKSFVQKHKVLLIAAASAVVLFGAWTLVWYLKGDFTKVEATEAVEAVEAGEDEDGNEIEAVEAVPAVPAHLEATEKSWKLANWYQTVVATPAVKVGGFVKGQFVNHPYRSTAITAGAILAIAATADLLRGADKSIIRSMFKDANKKMSHPAESVVA